MEKELKVDEKSISDDLAALQKKGKFLEKQCQEANSQLRDIVRRINALSRSPATPRLKQIFLFSSITQNQSPKQNSDISLP
jgi:hypothetical protein